MQELEEELEAERASRAKAEKARADMQMVRYNTLDSHDKLKSTFLHSRLFIVSRSLKSIHGANSGIGRTGRSSG